MAISDPTMSVPTPTGILQGVAAFNWDGAAWQPAGRAGPSVATPTGVLQGVAAFSGTPAQPSGRAGPGVATPTGVLDGVAVYTWSGSQWTPPGGSPAPSTPTGVLRGVAAFDWDGTAWQPAGQAGPDVPTPYGVLQGVARFGWTGSVWAATGAPSLSLDFMTPGTLDSRVTFTRASTATYTDASGTIQTAASNAPRWDYAGGVLRGLLIEEARTNIAVRSAQLDNAAAWNPSNVTQTANQAIAPDGTLTAARLDLAATSGAGFSMVGQGITVTAAVYSFSVWMRGVVGGERVWLCTTPNGVIYYRTPVVLTTAWQRVTLITSTLTATTWYMQIGVDLRDASQTPTSAQSIYAWGAQCEIGPFVSSHIQTVATSATRAADIATMPTAGWYNGTASTFMVGAMLPANGNNGYRGLFTIDAGVSGSWIRALTLAGGPDVAGFADGASFDFGNMTPGVPFKCAVNYSSTRVESAFNGAVGIPGAFGPATAAGYTTLRLGQADTPTGNYTNGYLRQLAYWPRLLNDTEMQQVTK